MSSELIVKMSDHYPEPVLLHCQSSEVEPALGMNTLTHHWHEQPVFVGAQYTLGPTHTVLVLYRMTVTFLEFHVYPMDNSSITGLGSNLTKW